MHIALPPAHWRATPLACRMHPITRDMRSYSRRASPLHTRLLTSLTHSLGPLQITHRCPLTYRDVRAPCRYYAEPWDASSQQVRNNPAWQLRGADGKPLNPESKFVYNMTIPAVQQFYTAVVANLSAKGWVDGAFADSGCGVHPAWLPVREQRSFAAGQLSAAAASQAALNPQGGLFIQNCPYLPREPGSSKSDPWSPGVRGVMYESWCSDFATGTGGPGTASFCRYEILYTISGPAGWKNHSVIQARYYLSPHNRNDPRFGAIAFMICGYPGAYFGASTDWWWKGDWETQSMSDWAHQPLGDPDPAQMLDKAGCGWSRRFASGARVFVNLCFANGHPMEAHAVWADNTTWPASLGADAAFARVSSYQTQRQWSDEPVDQRLPAPYVLHPIAENGFSPCPLSMGGGSTVRTVDGTLMCLRQTLPQAV
eukprot:m.113762 g.113762  ORF g.113762 m.113762 type:complete len:427 (-) comp21486_c0_seq1:234-1514(-)